MVTAVNTLGFPKLTNNFVPNLKGKANDEVVREIRRMWNSTWQLRDASSDVINQTLTADFLINRDLVPGKPLLVLMQQDSTGGWNWDYAKNPDQTTKFHGTALITPDTTANTYTLLYFFATTETDAWLMSWLSGGDI